MTMLKLMALIKLTPIIRDTSRMEVCRSEQQTLESNENGSVKELLQRIEKNKGKLEFLALISRAHTSALTSSERTSKH
jgi:hypothetical protein